MFSIVNEHYLPSTVKGKAFKHDDTGQQMIKGPITIKLTCDIQRPALIDNLLSLHPKAP